MHTYDKIYINGAWVPSEGKGVLEVTNSATEEIIATIPDGTVGDVDNLCAVLGFASGRTAVVDLSRNSRYGDDVRTELLGERGAIFVDLLPTGRARLADADGVREIDGSQAVDATLAGVAAQAHAFARRVAGDDVDVPTAAASARSTLIGHAVMESARTSREVTLTP